jgi:acylphosphatase
MRIRTEVILNADSYRMKEMMLNKYGIHCLISGKVQGVCFRASTQDEASTLGLTGWARNLPDGRVEVIAFGEKDKLLLLFEWLKKGPALSKVDQVTYEEITWQEHVCFTVK